MLGEIASILLHWLLIADIGLVKHHRLLLHLLLLLLLRALDLLHLQLRLRRRRHHGLVCHHNLLLLLLLQKLLLLVSKHWLLCRPLRKLVQDDRDLLLVVHVKVVLPVMSQLVQVLSRRSVHAGVHVDDDPKQRLGKEDDQQDPEGDVEESKLAVRLLKLANRRLKVELGVLVRAVVDDLQ